MRICIALCEDLEPFTKPRYANPRCANSRYARNPCSLFQSLVKTQRIRYIFVVSEAPFLALSLFPFYKEQRESGAGVAELGGRARGAWPGLPHFFRKLVNKAFLAPHFFEVVMLCPSTIWHILPPQRKMIFLLFY